MARLRPVALFATLTLVVTCGEALPGPRFDAEESAGTWKPFVIASSSVLRPAAPPAAGSAQASQELDEIVALQRARSAATDSAIARWSVIPTKNWHALALDRMEVYWVLLPDVRLATAPRTARAMALLNVAMYDALVAAWDAKYTYRRKSPAGTDARVRALIETGGVPRYPSDHAAVEAAAAAGLSYIFPSENTLSFYS